MPLPLPVRAKGCVQACYNAAIPYMVPELPTPQKEALSKAVRAVMLRTQVAIRDWKLPIPDVDDLHLVGIGRVRVVVRTRTTVLLRRRRTGEAGSSRRAYRTGTVSALASGLVNRDSEQRRGRFVEALSLVPDRPSRSSLRTRYCLSSPGNVRTCWTRTCSGSSATTTPALAIVFGVTCAAGASQQ